MRFAILLFPLFILAGCSSSKINETNIKPPELLETTQLPEIPHSIYHPDMTLDVKMLIDTNGTVSKVIFMSHTADTKWDSLAAISMKSWKFSPALINTKPIPVLIRKKLIVKLNEPLYISVTKILCKNFSCADSAFKALTSGALFDSVLKRFSIAGARTINAVKPEKINILNYPERIQSYLLKLSINEFTPPISYGNKYVIFKRVK